MANRQDLIIELREFPIFLGGRYPGGVKAIAEGLGVSQQLAYMLMSGVRKPSAAILEKCGLEVVYRAVPPEKGKRTS